MPKVNLYGSDGVRSLEVNPASDLPISKDEKVLSPITLQEIIKLMPRRWYNISELVKLLTKYHQIPANHEMVFDALKYCELEMKGIGHDMSVRRHDDEESEIHRKASFAAARKLRPLLEKSGIDEDTLWDWVKSEYNVQSRTQMDPYQWSSLSAHFNAALRDRKLLKYLVQQIQIYIEEKTST